MIEPSTTEIWIFVAATFLHGTLLMAMVYFLLRSKGKQYVATYNSDKKLYEDGPLLELPEGVSLSKTKKGT